MAALKSGLTTICAIVRNEAAYLHEWIAYHKAIGVGKFVIYDNDSADGTTDILLHLQRQGWLTRIAWPTPEFGSPQILAYADFIAEHEADDAFATFIDVDEFLALPSGMADIGRYFEAYGLAAPGVSAIAVNQRVFGSSGKTVFEPGFVIERFTKSAFDDYSENRWFKSLFRPARAYAAMKNPHHIELHCGRYVDSVGRDLPRTQITGGQTPNIADGLRLNHYIIKSLEEFRLKQARGGAAGATSAARAARYNDDFFFGRDTHLNNQSWAFPEPFVDALKGFATIPKAVG